MCHVVFAFCVGLICLSSDSWLQWMTRWRSTPTLRARLLSTLHSCTRSRDTETSYRSILVIVFPILELMYFMYYLCNLLYIFLLTVKQQFVKSILYIDFTEFTAEQYYFMKHTCISVSVLSTWSSLFALPPAFLILTFFFSAQDYTHEFHKTKGNFLAIREREDLLGSVRKDIE